jgi:type III secretion protein R
MPDPNINIIGILIFVTAAALIPLAVVTMTAFLKISIVLFMVRSALGLQQSPPGLVLYGIALILTLYVTMPLGVDIYARLSARPPDLRSAAGLMESAQTVRAPLQAHLMRFTHEGERKFFMTATTRLWPESARADLKDDDLIVLMPAFVSSELTRAFEIGFLLYLPFLIIDLVVSNVLMAMGMIMVSPTLISVPLKLLLFVAVAGWSRLLHGLILSYA